VDIFLMCNGRQDRFQGALRHPKQCIDIAASEMIIERTARLATGRGRLVLVSPDDVNWQAVADIIRAPILSPGPTATLAESLLAALIDPHVTPGDVAVLLGDVVYSNACLNAVVEDGAEIRVVGRTGGNPVTGKPYAEAFGMYVPEHRREEMVALLERISKSHRIRAGLWQIFYDLSGLRGPSNSRYLRELKNDWTDDVDTLEDLVLLPKLRACAAEDDPPGDR
jgi:hypothetical protein